MKNMEKALASQGQSWKIMEWEFKKKIGQEKFLGFAPFSKKGARFWEFERSEKTTFFYLT